jgi:hypothetical protein
MYNARMITFNETKDGYIFSHNNDVLALGMYENNAFHLFHQEKVIAFSNAMQAYCHLNSIYKPGVPSPQTMELFTKPSRPIDNMSKWMNNPVLDNMPKEVFHANLHS